MNCNGISEYILNSKEYNLILKFYGIRTANRSRVPLMNHINEGLLILNHINSPIEAMLAFCIHPLIQSDQDLQSNFSSIIFCEREALVLAIEYRNIANQYLSHRKIDNINEISLSPLSQVNQMLIADKIQNYKDFLLYHKASHDRSVELDQYFNNWLKRLNITISEFNNICYILS